MLKRFFGPKTHDNINTFAVFTLAVGLPVSKVVMSLGTLLLALNFFLNADFKSYWERGKKSIVFWFITLVIVFHLLGLIYTTDLSYAFRDLNTKLPFFAIPIIMVTYPIRKGNLNYIFYGFLIALVITSILNFKYMVNNEAKDYRDFSLFGSHIRYALLVVTGVLLSIYLWLKNQKMGLIYFILISWLSCYTFISQVLSGYIALLLLFLGCFTYLVRVVKKTSIKVVFTVCFIGVLGFCGFQLYNYIIPEKPSLYFKNLPEQSKYGEKYYHDTTSIWFENGHHIPSYIAGNELEAAWNKRSDIDYLEKLESGYKLKNILIRYMASKGLTKDKEGMKSMSDQDIKNVENGITSIQDTYGIFKSKLSGLKDEVFHYSIGGDPDGNSLLQRFEHWKAGKTIIKNNWLIGVGTGDLQLEFNKTYAASDTPLDKSHWNRAHNQFMTFWIGFGIFGFLVFSLFWFWFLWKNIKLNNLIGIVFSLIAIGSFMSEDTIETQQGVTYIALFLGLVTLMNNWKEKEKADV